MDRFPGYNLIQLKKQANPDRSSNVFLKDLEYQVRAIDFLYPVAWKNSIRLENTHFF